MIDFTILFHSESAPLPKATRKAGAVYIHLGQSQLVPYARPLERLLESEFACFLVADTQL